MSLNIQGSLKKLIFLVYKRPVWFVASPNIDKFAIRSNGAVASPRWLSGRRGLQDVEISLLLITAKIFGAVAEWLGRGLQNLLQRFESAQRLLIKAPLWCFLHLMS